MDKVETRGRWVKRSSTIEIDVGPPDSQPDREESESPELFLSDLFSNVGARAKQAASYVSSRWGAPTPSPVAPVKPPVAPFQPPAPARSPTRLPVPEAALTALLPVFADFTYDLHSVRYPWAIPGVSLPLAPPKLINCCTFVEALVVRAWADQHGTAFRWDSRRHSQMMISTGSDLFSPVTAAIEAEMATPIPAGQPPDSWCIGQYWRSTSSGHTMIILARHAPTDRVLTLEANSYYSLNGVGYRKFGNLRDFPGNRPPARWWDNPAAPTWKEITSACANGPGIKLARLNVQGASWAGLPALA